MLIWLESYIFTNAPNYCKRAISIAMLFIFYNISKTSTQSQRYDSFYSPAFTDSHSDDPRLQPASILIAGCCLNPAKGPAGVPQKNAYGANAEILRMNIFFLQHQPGSKQLHSLAVSHFKKN